VPAQGSTSLVSVFVPPLFGTIQSAALPTATLPTQVGAGVAAFSNVAFIAPENPIPRIVTSAAPGGSGANATTSDAVIPEEGAPSAPPANGQAPAAPNAVPPQGATPGQQNAPRQGGEAPQGDQRAPAAKEPAPAAPGQRSEQPTPERPKAPLTNPAPALPPAPRGQDKGPKDQGKPPAQEPPKDSNSGLFRRLGPVVGAAAILGLVATHWPAARWERRRKTN
jgi:hypothetical protein